MSDGLEGLDHELFHDGVSLDPGDAAGGRRPPICLRIHRPHRTHDTVVGVEG